jgi:polyhydroxybutyrate depolymerase
METLDVNVGGQARRAFLARARGGSRSMPVVIMLHGAGGTADIAARQTGWDRKGAEQGFLAVFPEGTLRDPSRPPEFRRNPQTWNDGSARGHVARSGVDDVAFMDALIDALITRAGADPGAIFLTGFSNGGSLAFRAAGALPGRVAAVAPVAGHCWIDPRPGAVPPLLYLMGDADPLNPIEGGTVSTPWGGEETHPAALRSFQRWSGAAGCEGWTAREDGPVTWTEASGCPASVRMGVIHGHGHIWPGGPRLLPQRIVGHGIPGLDATDLIWRFFSGARPVGKAAGP